MIKTFNRTELLHPNKGLYKKPTANIISSGERLGALPLRLGARQRCLPLSLLFNNTGGVLKTKGPFSTFSGLLAPLGL